MKYLIIRTLFALMLCLFCSDAVAINKNNRDRWSTPSNSGPDKDVPGYLINLGPTGARAILEAKAFIVKYVFEGSPAKDKLKINDVITGVNGKAFETPHVFNQVRGQGYEGPMMDFGNAIEDSEGKDGKLVLSVKRKNESLKITVQLKTIGKFSETFPFNCPKSNLIAREAKDYVNNYPDIHRTRCHAKALAGLALLADDQLDKAKTLAHSWKKIPGNDTWTWPVSFQTIFLSEYYLRTKDKTVLNTLKGLVAILDRAGVKDPSKYKNNTHSGKNVSKSFKKGGFGHISNIEGYGSMAITTGLALIGWELARKCNVTINETYISDSFSYMNSCTASNGYIGYNGPRGGYSPVGRCGISLIAHKIMKNKSDDSKKYVDLMSERLSQDGKKINDAHADNTMAVCWSLIGAIASGNDKPVRGLMDYNKAWFNMARCHDGSFVTLPGRDQYDKGYYMSSRLQLTSGLAIVFGSSGEKNLYVLGGESHLSWLKPNGFAKGNKAIYESILSGEYIKANKKISSIIKKHEKDLASEKPKRTNPKYIKEYDNAKNLLKYNAIKSKRAVDNLIVIQKQGDFYKLKASIADQTKKLRGLEYFDKQEVLWKALFKTKAVVKILSIGKAFYKLKKAYLKSASASNVKKINKFIKKYPQSTYAAQAKALLK